MKITRKILPLFITTISIIWQSASAQSAYNDAVALEKLLNSSNLWPLSAKEQVASILANYCKKAEVKSRFFNNNEFISPYAVTVMTSFGGLSGNQNPIPSAIGGFNVANMANGLALFLIDRAKGEINEAFFVRLNEFLENYPEFATLFPNTRAFLSNFKSWEYPGLLNTLKEAFNKDIISLPADFIKLKDLNCNSVTDTDDQKKCNTRITVITNFLKSKEGLLFLSACKLGDGFMQGNKIPDVIDPVINTEYLLNTTIGLPDNAKNGLQLLNIINKSIKSNETGKSYITEDQFNLLSTDAILRNLYLGLIWEEMELANNNSGLIFTIPGQPNLKVTHDIFKKTDVDGIINYITNIYNQTKNVQTAYDNLKKDRLDAKTNLSPDYEALIESVQQLLQSLRTTSIIDTRISIPADADIFFKKANDILQITGQIFNKNFSAAMMGSLNLISSAVNGYDSKNPQLSTFCQDFLKYSSLAANFVEVKTPEEAKAAIEAVALPVGSYTIKQKSDYNISLNGYVGYTFDVNYASGIYAPVGFSFSKGSTKKNGWAVTIFTGLIDVGSMVSYNLQSGNTSIQKQEIRLESIFSPSAQLFFEIGRTPISFGGGYRRTPKLFYSKSDGTFNAVPANDVFSLSLLIDIPIFSLHNTPFK